MFEAKFNNHSVFKIFPTSFDHLKWNKLIEYIKHHPDFTTEEKNEIIEAYKYLSDVLGKRFLFHCQKHQLKLGQKFTNKAPWVLKWCIWLADAIKIQKKAGYDKFILDKLKSKKNYHEGIVFLELLYFFNGVGFEFSFEQQVKVKDLIKNPDIKLFNPETNENIYIEVSELNPSDEHRIGNRTFDIVSNCLFHSGTAFCGKILNFDRTQLEPSIEKLEKALNEVKDTQSFFELNEWPFHIGISISSSCEKLNEWAIKNQYEKNGLTGEEISLTEEIKRVKNKIQDKADQLGENNNNIVLIHAHVLFFIGVDIAELFIEIIKELKKYPKLFGVLIYGDFSLAEKEGYSFFNNHFIATRVFENVDKRTFLFIQNNDYSSLLSQESKTKFYNAFKFGKENLIS